MVLVVLTFPALLLFRWARPKSFTHFLSALILGKSIYVPQAIEANQNADGIKEDVDFWDKRVRDAETRAKKRAEEYAREQEQYLKDLEEIGDASGDLSIQKSGGFSLPDPTRAYLYPIQNYMSK